MRPSDPRATPWKSSPFRTELRALYDRVDALLAPWSCDASTACCRFGVTGREPYPTPVEVKELTHAIRAHGGILSGKAKRPLPLVAGDASEKPCPLLGDDGRCRVYASRPFGCRTFFCERAVGPSKFPRQEIQALSRAVADLAARMDPRDPHARPLTRVLSEILGREVG
ncbi:MAG: YkgJ family cysteine cluster protein [Polyangiaceae bacterium]